jgi:5'-deoxynucleotidase
MSHFFAILSRMKFIRRWSLMRNTIEENVQEHTLQTAMIAYHLCLLHNRYYADGGTVDAGRAVMLALYHDASEVFTGDMPTPVKYFSPVMRRTYGEVEELAQKRLVETLPEDLQPDYEPLICHAEEDPVWPFVKAADTLSAYLKCLQEKHAGNSEFNEAYETIGTRLQNLGMPEVQHFLRDYAPSFLLSLDDMNTES